MIKKTLNLCLVMLWIPVLTSHYNSTSNSPGSISPGENAAYQGPEIAPTESRQDKAGRSTAIPVTLASGQIKPDTIVASKTDLYWVGYGNKRLMKMSKNGGSPVTLFTISSAQDSITFTAADETGVYFATSNRIMRIDNNGGQPVVLASTIHNYRLALDETSVYWTGRSSTEKQGTFWLLKVSKGGGAIAHLSSIYDISPLTIDRTNVYWIEELTGDLRKIRKIGGKSSTIAKGLISVIDMAVDETSIYALDAVGTIVKIDKATGALETLAPQMSASSHQIAIDETSAYWTTQDKIMKVSKSGGQPVVLAAGQRPSAGIVVDGTSVYWTEVESGLVMRVDKKLTH